MSQAISLTPEKLREKWAEALESGRYRGGKHRLRKVNKDGSERYCCLGVLCDIYNSEGWDKALILEEDGNGEMTYMGNSTVLPHSVKNAVGLRTADGEFFTEKTPLPIKTMRENTITLTNLNDSGTVSFTDIARIIREAPRGLFVEK